MSKYFDKFPVVEYNGDTVRNIMARVNVYDQSRENIYQYYDYTLTEDVLRPDQLAYNYYKNSNFDWVFYLVNNTLDPYYGYYLSSENFENYIIGKYITLENAQSKILFYRNNWPLMEGSSIPKSTYDALDSSLQKYYRPVLDVSYQPYEYVRVQEDWIRSTNCIVSLSIESNKAAYTGLVVQQGSVSGEVSSIDYTNNCLIVKHTTGNFVPGVTLSSGEMVTEVNVLSRPIPEAEAGFWSAVSAYEYEYEQNEMRKQIYVLPDANLSKFESDFNQMIKM